MIHNDAGRTEDTAYCTTTVKLDNGAPCLWIIHAVDFWSVKWTWTSNGPVNKLVAPASKK